MKPFTSTEDYRSKCPEFTAYELNELKQWGKKDSNYRDAITLYLGNGPVSEGQMRWLWAIKKELEEA